MYQDSTAGKMKNFLFANVSWAQAFSLLRLCQCNVIFCRLFFLGFTLMAIPVVEFSRGGYKIRKVFYYKSTVVK